MKKKSSYLLLFLIFASTAAIGKEPFLVITWGGNSPDWNRVLHLSGVRVGCSGAPPSCMQEVDQMARSQGVSRVFLAILLNPANAATNAAAYGSLSTSDPNLTE